MKYSVIASFMLFLSFNQAFSQFLAEQEVLALSKYAKDGDMKGFETFLSVRGFYDTGKDYDGFKIYNWKKKDGHYYGVKVFLGSSKQVYFMTNDQNYALLLLSKYIMNYDFVSSNKQGEYEVAHLFDTGTARVALLVDHSDDSRTHRLIAVSKL